MVSFRCKFTFMRRRAAVAGKFYPDNQDKLKEMIESFIVLAKDYEVEKPKIAVVPHAGYVFSGRTAAAVYKVLEKFDYEIIFLLGPAHYFPLEEPVTSSFSFWETPLGKVEVDKGPNEFLKLEVDDRPFLPEHSLEVQLPFLQFVYSSPRIFPIHINEHDEEFAGRLLDLVEKNYYDALFLISSDLSHYFPEEEAVHIDKHSIKIMLEKDLGRVSEIDACGQAAIATGLYLAKHLELSSKLLFYDTSASAFGETSEVVGYVGMVYY